MMCVVNACANMRVVLSAPVCVHVSQGFMFINVSLKGAFIADHVSFPSVAYMCACMCVCVCACVCVHPKGAFIADSVAFLLCVCVS